MATSAGGKAYYMISAVAQKYTIHPQTLRLYEREGLLKPSRTEGNTRLYSEEDLEQLETILSLTRDLGVNLAGVEIILNMRRKMEQMQGEVNEFMEYVKHELSRGLGDWEQRLSTAMVKSSPTDLVRARRRPTASRPTTSPAERRQSNHEDRSRKPLTIRVTHRRATLRIRSRWPASVATTPDGKRSRPMVSAASCAATAGAKASRARLFDEARIPPRYRNCDLRQLRQVYPNEKLTNAAGKGAAFAERVPRRRRRACA